MITSFNLRVYGILEVQNKVLISYENRYGMEMIKFPGGGLEKGEGLNQCLVREFDEELGVNIQVGELFYVNDFFQESAFNSSDQLISFYYRVKLNHLLDIDIENWLKQLPSSIEQKFKWHTINDLKSIDFTFPIDKIVSEKLLEK